MPVVRVCLVCGREFRVKPSVVTRGHGKFCSKKCEAEYRKKRVKLICEQCGKEYEVWESVLKQSKSRFCSKKCFEEYRKSEKGKVELLKISRSIWQNPENRRKVSESMKIVWQNPTYREKWMESRKAKWENPEYRKKRSEETKILWQNFEFREKCIRRVMEALKIKPNGLERAFCDLLQSYFTNEWSYVGGGKVFIGGFVPDFMHKEEKWIIEVNGDYWHSFSEAKEKDRRKRETYEKYGYKVLEVWESEIRSVPIGVVNKIVRYFYRES
jgi:G:T-mismatch repair DNA endonuclease (very short patch repair protein)